MPASSGIRLEYQPLWANLVEERELLERKGPVHFQWNLSNGPQLPLNWQGGQTPWWYMMIFAMKIRHKRNINLGCFSSNALTGQYDRQRLAVWSALLFEVGVTQQHKDISRIFTDVQFQYHPYVKKYQFCCIVSSCCDIKLFSQWSSSDSRKVIEYGWLAACQGR